MPEGPAIGIGAQDWQSPPIGQIYQGPGAAGYDVSVQDLAGFQELVFDGFESGDINLPRLRGFAARVPARRHGEGRPGHQRRGRDAGQARTLPGGPGPGGAPPSDAVDTNAFVITQQTSDDKGITTLSDLAAKGADLTLGAAARLRDNGFCIPGLMRCTASTSRRTSRRSSST